MKIALEFTHEKLISGSVSTNPTPQPSVYWPARPFRMTGLKDGRRAPICRCTGRRTNSTLLLAPSPAQYSTGGSEEASLTVAGPPLVGTACQPGDEQRVWPNPRGYRQRAPRSCTRLSGREESWQRPHARTLRRSPSTRRLRQKSKILLVTDIESTNPRPRSENTAAGKQASQKNRRDLGTHFCSFLVLVQVKLHSVATKKCTLTLVRTFAIFWFWCK